MVKILFCHDLRHKIEIEYAFRILASSLDCELVTNTDSGFYDDTCLVSYGYNIPVKTCRNHLHICADPSFWDNFLHPESLPKEPIHRFSLQSLRIETNDILDDPLICPYVYQETDREPLRWQSADSKGSRILICNLDLIASVFFWVTRYEELFVQERDEYGRIPDDRLLCVREDCFSRPLVDEYAELLLQLLKRVATRISAARKTFRVLATHDIDSGIPVKGGAEYFEYGLRSLYRETFRERRLKAGLTDCLQWSAVGLGIRSYGKPFREIVETDRKYGFTSHFFMMANGTHPKDSQSNIFSPYSRKIISDIVSEGGRIGLHLGIDSHAAIGQFRQEWDNIRAVVPNMLSAARSHYLVFNVPETWELLSQVGCRVDSTCGFSERMGFRAGTSHPFRPFDVSKRCIRPIWEYSLVLMDKNLFIMSVRSDSERMGKAQQVIDKVIACGGCFVINWHNMYFFSDYQRMYTDILAYVAGRGHDVRLDSTPEPDSKVIW